MQTVKQKRLALPLCVTAILLLVIFFFAVNTGGIHVTPAVLFRGLFIAYDRDVSIILQLRFPRIVMAMIGGALMSISGVLMQAVMRNPLADPGIIGVSSGAAFAAVLVSSFLPSLAMFTPLFSLAGGLLAFLLVYLLARGETVSPIRLILTGIAVDALFSGLYQAFNSRYSGAQSIISANISQKNWDDVRMLCIYATVAVIPVILCVHTCDLFSLSDHTVQGLGVNLRRARLLLALLSVFMASVFTAMIGAVAFLGLIVPHCARLIVGSAHKRLIPYSALLGATIFLLADTVGRAVAYPYEISAAIVMTIIGGPAFIVLLKKSGGIYGA